MIFFSSDWHLNHSNIAGPKVSNWKQGYRNFDNVSKMNETIINNVNSYVGENDVLYFLGDLCFKDHALTPKWRDRIHCKNFHWIVGNHDKHAFKYKDYFSSIQHYLEIEVEKKKFILSHYSFRIWNGSHKGNYHLYGHSHANLEHLPNGKSMDVGIDNAYLLYKEYRPFSINEIVKILDKKEINFIDHHNKETDAN